MTLWKWLLSFDEVTLLLMEDTLWITVGTDGKAFTGFWQIGIGDLDALIRSFETQVDIEHYIPHP